MRNNYEQLSKAHTVEPTAAGDLTVGLRGTQAKETSERNKNRNLQNELPISNEDVNKYEMTAKTLGESLMEI